LTADSMVEIIKQNPGVLNEASSEETNAVPPPAPVAENTANADSSEPSAPPAAVANGTLPPDISMGSPEATPSPTGLEDVPVNPAEIPLLNDISNQTFQKMSDFERANQLLKLEAEQEKLKTDLARIRAERIKYEAMAEQAANPPPASAAVTPAATASPEATPAPASEEGPAYSESGESVDGAEDSSEETPSEDAENSEDSEEAAPAPTLTPVAPKSRDSSDDFSAENSYSIKEIMGVEGNLIATLQDTSNNRKIRVKLGTKLKNGYVVSAISYEDGVTFEKGGNQQTLSFTPAEETQE